MSKMVIMAIIIALFSSTYCSLGAQNFNSNGSILTDSTSIKNLEREIAKDISLYKYSTALDKLGVLLVMQSQKDGYASIDAGDASLKKLFMQMILCYKKLNMFNDAIGVLNKYHTADTTDIQILGELADCWFLAANYKECINTYSKMLQIDSTNSYFELQRALVGIKGDYHESALRGLANLYRRGDSTNNIILRLMGDCLYQLGKGDPAIIFYNKAITAKPTDQLAVRKLATIYLNIDMADKALALTNAYIALDSINMAITEINGISRYVTRDFDGAIEVLEKLYKQGNDGYSVVYYLGLSKAAINHYYEAIPYLTQAYQFDTTDVKTVLHLGDAHCRAQSKEPRGIELLKQGVNEMQPKKATLFDYYTSFSVGYTGLRDYDNAIVYTKKCLEVKPEYTESLYNIGLLYEYKKDKKKAAETYREYLKIGKDRKKLGVALSRFKALHEELFMKGVEIKALDEKFVEELNAKIKPKKKTVVTDSTKTNVPIKITN